MTDEASKRVYVVGQILSGKPNFKLYIDDGISTLEIASFENAAVINAAREGISSLPGYRSGYRSSDGITIIRLLGTDDERKRLEKAIRRERDASRVHRTEIMNVEVGDDS